MNSDYPHLRQIGNAADFVVATRFAHGGRTDNTDDPMKILRLGNRFLTHSVNLVWGSNLTDSTNGLMAFRTSAWEKMRLNASHFEVEFLMPISATKLRLRGEEVSTLEGSRVGGEVQAKTSKVGIALLHVVVREMLEGSRFVR